MKHASLLCVVVIAGAIAGPAEAIYKCTTAKGIVYQDRPCREGTESDMRIVIPTGEIAPKSTPAQDVNAQVNVARDEGRFSAPRTDRPMADDPASVTKLPDRKSSNDAASSASEDTPKKSNRYAGDAPAPMTAEQAQKTEPSAKYYTTDGTASGVDTPEQMTCESPSGEKRRFVLTNGKLTSI